MNDFSQRVAARFDASTASYDAHSAAQRHAAQGLVERLVPMGLPPRPGVLEIGCGTGHLTESLLRHFPAARILATDIAPAMLAACRSRLGTNPRLRFATMDGRRPVGVDFFDLVCGNLVAQWFDDLPAACTRLVARLAPGGVLALCLLGSETFGEWKAAHTRQGLIPGTLPLPTAEACRAALPSGENHIEVERWIDRPTDGLVFLRALRAIGADTAMTSHTPLTPGKLRRVLRELGPTPAITYELIYLFHRRLA